MTKSLATMNQYCIGCTLPLLGQSEADQVKGLTTGGATIMIASIVLVTSLLAFCIVRILREPNPETHHHAPLDIDTKDYD